MRRSGPWSQAEVEHFLEETRIPIRVACNGESGFPLLASLWFTSLDGKLWMATQENARVVRWLEKDARCGFEVSLEAPPYRGVRGTGLASLHRDRGEEVLRRLISRYLGDTNEELAKKLLARVETEVAISIAPGTVISWDFRSRMKAVS